MASENIEALEHELDLAIDWMANVYRRDADKYVEIILCVHSVALLAPALETEDPRGPHRKVYIKYGLFLLLGYWHGILKDTKRVRVLVDTFTRYYEQDIFELYGVTNSAARAKIMRDYNYEGLSGELGAIPVLFFLAEFVPDRQRNELFLQCWSVMVLSALFPSDIRLNVSTEMLTLVFGHGAYYNAEVPSEVPFEYDFVTSNEQFRTYVYDECKDMLAFYIKSGRWRRTRIKENSVPDFVFAVRKTIGSTPNSLAKCQTAHVLRTRAMLEAYSPDEVPAASTQATQN